MPGTHQLREPDDLHVIVSRDDMERHRIMALGSPFEEVMLSHEVLRGERNYWRMTAQILYRILTETRQGAHHDTDR